MVNFLCYICAFYKSINIANTLKSCDPYPRGGVHSADAHWHPVDVTQVSGTYELRQDLCVRRQLQLHL